MRQLHRRSEQVGRRIGRVKRALPRAAATAAAAAAAAAATAIAIAATATRRTQRRVGDVRRRRARSPERRAERGGVREAPSIFFEWIGCLVGIEGDQGAHDRTVGAISRNLGPLLEQVHRPASAHLSPRASRGNQKAITRPSRGNNEASQGNQEAITRQSRGHQMHARTCPTRSESVPTPTRTTNGTFTLAV